MASLSEAQLLKYADYYIDSCLHPIVLKNEKIFRTEAWRYRLDDADAPLTIEGTVYTEMLGAWTLEENAYNNSVRAMFPGSKTCNEQGGDPDFIPDMTWEMLKDYHARYYHPSNCAAYLYGRFEDYAAFLELLDGYFSAYEKKEFSFADSGYDPITEPVVQSLPFPLEEGSSTENSSVIIYGFVCPGLKNDLEQELVINTMTDLFADDASGLQQSFQEALPYGTFESHIVTMGPEDAVTFIAKNVNPEDAEVFREIVDKAIADVAENGFPADLVDAVTASLETSALLTRESKDLVEELIKGDHQLAAGLVYVILKLFLGRQRVDHAGDGAQHVDCVEHVDYLRAVGHGYGDGIALADAQSAETPCASLYVLHHLSVGDGLAHEVQRNGMRALLGLFLHAFPHGALEIFECERKVSKGVLPRCFYC